MKRKQICSLFLFWFGFFGCRSELPERPPIQYRFGEAELSQILLEKEGWSTKQEVKYNFGYFQRTVWVRFEVINPKSVPLVTFLEWESPWMDKIRLVEVRKGKLYEHLHTGSQSFVSKEIHHRHPVFRLELEPNETILCYAEIENQGILSAPIRIWHEDAFVERVEVDYIANGMYFGILFALLLYNFLIFTSVRERAYAFYCAYLLSLLLNYSLLGGFIKQYVFPNLEFSVKPWLYVSVGLSQTFVGLFSYHFLRLKSTHPLLHHTIRASILVFLLGTIAFFLLPAHWIEISFVYSFPYLVLLLLVSGISSYRKGRSSSLFFVFAWLMLFFGVLFDSFTKMGLLPSTTFGRYGVQIGTAFEVILFSLALGRRLRALLEENAKTQSALFTIRKDLETARKIHERLLPAELPSSEWLEVFVTYHPLHEVGGDFYDFLQVGEKQIGVLLADVTGHGVSAALDSSTVKLSFRNSVTTKHSPKDLLSAMNEFLWEGHQTRFVSAAYFLFDVESYTLRFASAGNPPILVLRKGKVLRKESSGLLLGILPKFAYEETSIALERGDRILLFTDGLYESLDSEDPMELFVHLVEGLTHFPQKEFHKELEKSLSKHRLAHSDDVTLVSLQLK